MAISVFCLKCKKIYKLGKRYCQCGNDSTRNRKYRAMVKLPNGKWKSKVTVTLDLAQKVEAKYKSDAVKQSVFDIHKAPRIDEVWKKYLRWAKCKSACNNDPLLAGIGVQN